MQTDLLASGGRDDRPLATKTVANTQVVLHKALADAVRLGLLDHNVAAAVHPPRVPRPQLSVWNVDQLREFLRVVSSHRLSAAFVLLAPPVCVSEVLGLRWSDIDFDNRSLSIIRTLTVVDGRPVVSAPKTAASRRLVYLDASTIDALRVHRDAPTVSRDGYVFQSADGGQPVNPASFSTTFDRLVSRSGMPRIRLHDLRHTYATLALRLGTH